MSTTKSVALFIHSRHNPRLVYHRRTQFRRPKHLHRMPLSKNKSHNLAHLRCFKRNIHAAVSFFFYNLVFVPYSVQRKSSNLARKFKLHQNRFCVAQPDTGFAVKIIVNIKIFWNSKLIFCFYWIFNS